MKIVYLLLPDNDKLISYHVHDFKSKTIDNELFYIDGGQKGHIRIGGDINKCKIIFTELEEIFDFIRKDNTYFLNNIINNLKLEDLIIFKNIHQIKYTNTYLDVDFNYQFILLEIKNRMKNYTQQSLIDIRKKLNYKQSDVAKLLNISTSTYNRLETGKLIDEDLIIKLAKVYNLSVESLMPIDREHYKEDELTINRYLEVLSKIYNNEEEKSDGIF